jgi:ABC-type uncharacterized transport system permease subunit
MTKLKSVSVNGLVLCGAFAAVSVFALMASASPWAIVVILVSYTTTLIGFTEVLVHAIPLTLLGLGTAIALRAGLFNIGGDGQLICGALLAVAISPIIAGLSWFGLLLFLAAGFVGGGVLGGIVGILRAQFGASEIIVTIMLNYVCIQLASFAVRGPLQEPMHIFPRSFSIPADCILPILVDGTSLHAGIIVAAIATAIVSLMFARTSFGFQITVVGTSRGAANYSGLRVKTLIVVAMALSGGLAGLAGAVEVAGIQHRLEDNFAGGFGLSGIAVALIARLSPSAVPLAAILFGVFYAGAGALQRRIGLPFPLVWIVEAITIFAVAVLHWANSKRIVYA